MSISLSRFQITEGNPQQPPHKCAVCGSINGTFIDFGLDLEFYGTVYFCVENCFTQLANELGYRSPAQHHVALEEITRLRSECNTITDELERLNNAVDTLRHLDARDRGLDGDVISHVRERKLNDPIPASTESGSSEQTTKPGSTDILNDDGLNDLLSNS